MVCNERGKPVTEIKVVGKAKDTGTKIRFKPDPEIFEVTEFNYDTVAQRLRELAFLNKGVKLILIDERTGKKEEFYSEEGIKGFVALLNKNKPVLHDIIYYSGEKNGIIVEVALQFTDTEFETLFAFANNIHTVEGGT
ncbi:MAG TPA: DNA topoisomerase IV subunit B, partial [Hydrogenothermaceae bacterium]|nr:DNA topoisomerase IV subunit B [Hydrogenothermaceae bacterium]